MSHLSSAQSKVASVTTRIPGFDATSDPLGILSGPYKAQKDLEAHNKELQDQADADALAGSDTKPVALRSQDPGQSASAGAVTGGQPDLAGTTLLTPARRRGAARSILSGG